MAVYFLLAFVGAGPPSILGQDAHTMVAIYVDGWGRGSWQIVGF